jgi:hypothetical protein
MVPAPAKAVRTARPCPWLMARTLKLTHANALAHQAELLSVQAGPVSFSTVLFLHMGMLPCGSSQHQFFILVLPRSERQLASSR